MSYPLIWKSSRPNIALHLRDREKGLANTPTYRHNCQMWRTLVCDESSGYEKAWSVSSKTIIHFLGGRLYLDDFRTCYSLNGLNAMPALLYKNPDKSHTYKLKAYLDCSADLSTLPLPNGGHRHYILALTKCQNLIRIDLKTGHILHKIFLGCSYNFKYLTWDVFAERAVVCSTQSKSSRGLKSFVLFNVFPLEVVGQFTVTKEDNEGLRKEHAKITSLYSRLKQVFGSDICDANISDGMLIVMHRNDKVKMYNFEKFMEENMRFPLRLGEKALTGDNRSAASGVVGSHPTGILTNIQITDCPAVLLEVTCFNRDVFFGGHPWHYMYIPHRTDPLLSPNDDVDDETYLVSSVATNRLIENGPLDMQCDTDGEIKAFFHMDDSHRIIQLSDDELIVKAFHTRDDGKSELRTMFRLTPPTMKGHIKEDEDDDEDEEDDFMQFMDVEYGGTAQYTEWANWDTTLSGRLVNTQWRKHFRLRNKIREVNYDMELDFLLLSYIQTVASCSRYTAEKGKLQIHCNQTGRLLKRVDLDGIGCEFRHCIMEMDMDLMIHIYVDNPLGHMVCNLYRLQRSPEYEVHKLVNMNSSNVESDSEFESESESSVSS